MYLPRAGCLAFGGERGIKIDGRRAFLARRDFVPVAFRVQIEPRAAYCKSGSVEDVLIDFAKPGVLDNATAYREIVIGGL